jgi:hypothetical protein
MTSETIRILAEEDEVEIKGSLPGLHEVATRVHDVSTEVLQQNLKSFLERVEDMFAASAPSMKSFALKEVTLSVAVDGSGEFSLLGLTKASAKIEATFEITLVPKV